MKQDTKRAIADGMGEYEEEQGYGREAELELLRNKKKSEFARIYLEENLKQVQSTPNPMYPGEKNLAGNYSSGSVKFCKSRACLKTLEDCTLINPPHSCVTLRLRVDAKDDQGNKLEMVSTINN